MPACESGMKRYGIRCTLRDIAPGGPHVCRLSGMAHILPLDR